MESFNNTDMNGEEIVYVKLHGSEAFVPGGVGNLGTTLPPSGKTLGLKMYHTPTGVLVFSQKFKTRFVVPWANVQLASYAESNTKQPFTIVEKPKDGTLENKTA